MLREIGRPDRFCMEEDLQLAEAARAAPAGAVGKP
jgi:hypothetical protein